MRVAGAAARERSNEDALAGAGSNALRAMNARKEANAFIRQRYANGEAYSIKFNPSVAA